MPLETKMPTQNIDVTLTRTDPCRRNRTSLETCKSFTPRRKRLQSSKRHRFCKRHYIIGHLVLKKKEVCCSNPRVDPTQRASLRSLEVDNSRFPRVFEHHVFKDNETSRNKGYILTSCLGRRGPLFLQVSKRGTWKLTSDYAVLQHSLYIQSYTNHTKKCIYTSPVLLYQVQIYIHVQKTTVDMETSADERESNASLFHLWGTLLRDPL